MKEIRTIYMRMPVDVKGFVVKMFDDGEDYCTVVLNPCYNLEQQQKTYKHELIHIEGGDFDCDCDADMVELLRHA